MAFLWLSYGFWMFFGVGHHHISLFHNEDSLRSDPAFRSLLRKTPLLVPQRGKRAQTVTLGLSHETMVKHG